MKAPQTDDRSERRPPIKRRRGAVFIRTVLAYAHHYWYRFFILPVWQKCPVFMIWRRWYLFFCWLRRFPPDEIFSIIHFKMTVWKQTKPAYKHVPFAETIRLYAYSKSGYKKFTDSIKATSQDAPGSPQSG